MGRIGKLECVITNLAKEEKGENNRSEMKIYSYGQSRRRK